MTPAEGRRSRVPSALQSPKRRVALIGFMGAGKTTVGRALARRMGWRFCDLDDLIEQRERQTVAGIFASVGEEAFRRMESAALRSLLQEDAGSGDLVLALGGGAFVQADNRAVLDKGGAVTILLETSLQELQRRCQMEQKDRPLAREQVRFAELFWVRQPLYAQAQFRVHTDNKDIQQVAAEIERLLQPATETEVEK